MGYTDGDCRPAQRTGRRLPPKELQRWLDEGKECLLLDTRNDYEVRLGAFKNCVDFQLDNFREFPAKCKDLASQAREGQGGEELKEERVAWA